MSYPDLTRSLENYLDLALEVLSNWGQWLAEHERRVLESNFHLLVEHTIAADSLHAELLNLSQLRAAVLSEADGQGITCGTLKQLAQTLPDWHIRADLRQKVRGVENCMANLRRLNIAAWLLIHQCSRVVDETLLLMTSGSSMQGAYIDVPHADHCGGYILDTQG